ncbi:MAG: YwiC-like family protein [Thermoleophilia bacterium]
MPGRRTLREVVVPTEHGGWGFTAEPLVLGLLVAPGLPAVALTVVGMAVFLARRPLRLLSADRRAGRRLPRTTVAAWVLVALAGLVAAGVAVAAVTAAGPFWIPLAAALPFAAVQQWFDLQNRQRELLPEILGPLALAAFAPAMVLAAGVGAGVAAGAWLTLAARVASSILLVRVQIRRTRGRAFSTGSLHVVSWAAAAVLVMAAWAGWAPRLVPAALVGVALWNLFSVRRPPTTPKFLGWSQMAFGLAVVVLFAVGYHAGW